MNMLKKTVQFIGFVIFANVFLLCLNPLQDAEAKNVSKNKNVRLRIVKMTKEDIKILGKELDHPANFNIKGVKKALISMHYMEKTLITWGKKRMVFGKKAASRFAPIIQKVFMKVKPHSKVSFSIYNSGKKTTGDIFSKNETIIFKFETINGTPYVDDFDLKAETEADIITNWKLIPGPNQQFYSHKGFLGIPMKQKNMIAANLKKFKTIERDIETPVKNKNREQPKQDNKPHDKRRTLEKKLRYLKDLKQQNLITEEAYEQKVQELLDQL